MKKFFTFVLLCTSTLSFAQKEGWKTTGLPGGVRYDDIYFIDNTTGWTAGGGSGKVHKTTNGGAFWKESGTFTKYLRCIEFMDANIGLLGSLDASLYRTTDGGKTWTDIAPIISPQPAGVCGLAKADETTIYGVGIWSEPAFVIKSVDKGLNWTYIDMSAYANTLVDVFFFDADHGFVTGSKSEEEGGIVLYTENGGETWEEKIVTNHVSDRIWKIQTPDNKYFYGSIESFTGATRIIRSSDKGQTWELITVNPGYYYCQAVGFIDSLRGWTGGNETLFETKDGGSHWNKVAVGSTYNRFQKINENLAFLTGSGVYKFTRSTNVVTGSPDLRPYDPVHYITITPNPSDGKATAHVNFGVRTMAHVYLYNTMGKNLEKIFDGRVEAGEKEFPIDISGLPGQVFMVIVKTNEGMESAKMVKRGD